MISMDKTYRTRDGRSVRIICVDAPGRKPVVGFIENNPTIYRWNSNGSFFSELASKIDLFEVPDIEQTIFRALEPIYRFPSPSRAQAARMVTDALRQIIIHKQRDPWDPRTYAISHPTHPKDVDAFKDDGGFWFTPRDFT